MGLKCPTTYEQQIELLRKKGVVVNDEVYALYALSTLNYYRLSGYIFQYKESSDRYKENTSFEAMVALHRFDSSMRSVLLKYLEMIELYLRTKVSYDFAHTHGSGGHYESANFTSKEYHEKFCI